VGVWNNCVEVKWNVHFASGLVVSVDFQRSVGPCKYFFDFLRILALDVIITNTQ